MTAEHRRLEQARTRAVHWKRWGPYVSDRAWGTVREDYSADGTAWEFFPHEHARSRAYRWNEDGLAGVCDRHQEICLAVALWNGRDPILKERLFGLTGHEGNHGEDVKECYFHLDSTPTHSFMRMLYRYPQRAYPYEDLLETSLGRGRGEPEYELRDTGIFDDDRYFDVFVTYAKADAEDLLLEITVVNRGPDEATLHVLPTVWFRNTWSWAPGAARPTMRAMPAPTTTTSLLCADTLAYGARYVCFDQAPPLLFTENETNTRRLFGASDGPRFAKDAIDDCVVHGRRDAVNPDATGSKAAAHHVLVLAAGAEHTVRVRFTPHPPDGRDPFGDFATVMTERHAEADAFYATIIPSSLSADQARVMRQGFAGLLWTKQYYHYDIATWLRGDPLQPPPPTRGEVRNGNWTHLYNADVISMPDKWEYPWYAAWDLAFHCVPLAQVDAEFAKSQLVLMLREWYMHPNGQLPAYEWNFGNVNPPVHAWAAWRVYEIDRDQTGVGDVAFLERVFHKLLLNFTWWVNRQDEDGNNVFEGGFLGLDNIGVFDRSQPLPHGGYLEQSDGTSWMAMYSLNLLTIALELARHDRAYEDVASKFWEHFIYIAYAMGHHGHHGEIQHLNLWNEDDGFFYDVLRLPDGHHEPVKIRSMVGLIPLFAAATLDTAQLENLPAFTRRMQWFLDNRPELSASVQGTPPPGGGERLLLSLLTADRLRLVLSYMLDEDEFLSPFGIRSLSRVHEAQPFSVWLNGVEHRVDYEPGESSTPLFGGNSNWRGPVWLPVNLLIIESLQTMHRYFGDAYRVECPTRSGQWLSLREVADEIGRRLSMLFLADAAGRRPVLGHDHRLHQDPHWRDYVPFHEYFHADTGQGLGASHQTGWTALIVTILGARAGRAVGHEAAAPG
ncbi:MAG: glucosidase [Acidobacteria bacterium]|nr:glucosidase [Acidobacteriota bacterium]